MRLKMSWRNTEIVISISYPNFKIVSRKAWCEPCFFHYTEKDGGGGDTEKKPEISKFLPI
jgi:hypothetical protein